MALDPLPSTLSSLILGRGQQFPTGQFDKQQGGRDNHDSSKGTKCTTLLLRNAGTDTLITNHLRVLRVSGEARAEKRMTASGGPKL